MRALPVAIEPLRPQSAGRSPASLPRTRRAGFTLIELLLGLLRPQRRDLQVPRGSRDGGSRDRPAPGPPGSPGTQPVTTAPQAGCRLPTVTRKSNAGWIHARRRPSSPPKGCLWTSARRTTRTWSGCRNGARAKPGSRGSRVRSPGLDGAGWSSGKVSAVLHLTT